MPAFSIRQILLLVVTFITFSSFAMATVAPALSGQEDIVFHNDQLLVVRVEAAPAGNVREARAGDIISMHYTGTRKENGRDIQFDSSRGRGPLDFPLGQSAVIQGWDRGLIGIRKGEKRRLEIQPEWAYGSRKMGPIPANSVLCKFIVDLCKLGSVHYPWILTVFYRL